MQRNYIKNTGTQVKNRCSIDNNDNRSILYYSAPTMRPFEFIFIEMHKSRSTASMTAQGTDWF